MPPPIHHPRPTVLAAALALAAVSASCRAAAAGRSVPTPERLTVPSGFRVTLFEAQGRDGSVSMLYTETERRSVPAVADQARAIDPRCYYVVDDIRVASSVDTPPKRSIVPGARFSANTSAFLTSSLTSSTPRAVLRSTVADFLLALRILK